MVRIKQERPSAEAIVTLELPVGEVSITAYLSNHLEIGRLSQNQARGLARLRRGLAETGATLHNGRSVLSAPDVIRYVLEQTD